MLLDAEAANVYLAGTFGASKAVGAPASHTLHLFASDGTQLTTGYTAPSITNNGTSWPAPSAGLLTGAAVTITYTAALSQPASSWALLGSDGFWYGGGRLPLGPWAGGAATSDTFQPTLSLALGAF